MMKEEKGGESGGFLLTMHLSDILLHSHWQNVSLVQFDAMIDI